MEKACHPCDCLGVFLPGELLARGALGVHQYLCGGFWDFARRCVRLDFVSQSGVWVWCVPGLLIIRVGMHF